MTIVSLNAETSAKQRWTKRWAVDWSNVPPPIKKAAETILECDPDATLRLPTFETWTLRDDE